MLKLFKYLMVIPIIGWLIAILLFALACPFVVTGITCGIYREKVSTGLKKFLYVISAIGGISLVVAIAMGAIPFVYLFASLLVLIISVVVAFSR